MGFLDNVKRWTQEKSAELNAGVKKYKNKDFLEATTAGCAMVAFADGIVQPEEKSKMAGFIERNEALKVFDIRKVIDSFETYVKGFEFDYVIGKGEALKAIAKIKKDSDEARLLVRVCCAIGAADNDFDNNEKRVVIEICKELGIDPAEFDLKAEPAKTGSAGGIQSKSSDEGMPDWMRR